MKDLLKACFYRSELFNIYVERFFSPTELFAVEKFFAIRKILKVFIPVP